MDELILIKEQRLKNLISSLLEEKMISLNDWIESKLIQKERPLTASEAMKYLSMSRTTFYRNVNNGVIHKFGLGNSIFFLKSQLNEAMKKLN